MTPKPTEPIQKEAVDMNKTNDGATRIKIERQRQINSEGWTAHHDRQHTKGELAMAACCYAAPVQLFEQSGGKLDPAHVVFSDPWPFDFNWDKRRDKNRLKNPKDPAKMSGKQRIDLLVKAGALIAAEIDRLLRINQ